MGLGWKQGFLVRTEVNGLGHLLTTYTGPSSEGTLHPLPSKRLAFYLTFGTRVIIRVSLGLEVVLGLSLGERLLFAVRIEVGRPVSCVKP